MDCDKNTCFLMPRLWGGVGGEGDKVPLAKLLVTGSIPSHGASHWDLEQVHNFSTNSLLSGEQKLVRCGISDLPKLGFLPHMLFQYFAVPIVKATISAQQHTEWTLIKHHSVL